MKLQKRKCRAFSETKPHRDLVKALNQNRTDDLILTMDVLCQLSYKGKSLKQPFLGTLPQIYTITREYKKQAIWSSGID